MQENSDSKILELAECAIVPTSNNQWTIQQRGKVIENSPTYKTYVEAMNFVRIYANNLYNEGRKMAGEILGMIGKDRFAHIESDADLFRAYRLGFESVRPAMQVLLPKGRSLS